MLVYSIFKLVSLFWSIDSVDAILSAIFWFNITFLYLVFKNSVLSKEKIKDIRSIVIVAGIFNSVVAIMQGLLFYFYKIKMLNIYGWAWPWGFRVTGVSFDANHLAAFLLLPLYLSLDRIFKEKGLKKIIYISTSSIFLTVIYFSASRSGLIAILFGVITLTFYELFGNKILKFFATLAFTLIPIILLLIFIFYTAVFTAVGTSEFIKINSEIHKATSSFLIHSRGIDQSALAHFALIYSSFYLQADHNFLGTGSGNFAEGIKSNTYLSKVYSQVDPDVLARDDFPSHSMYAEALGEGGFIGLTTLMLIFILISKNLLKLKNEGPTVVFLLSSLIFMIFYNLNEEFFWLFLFLSFIKISHLPKKSL